MTAEMWLALAILVVAIILFVTEWLRVDVVALGVVVTLMITGLLTTAEALAGFSNAAVLTIVALFIVGGAVLHTGLAALVGQRLLIIAGTNETRLIVVIMIAVAFLSSFISSTGTVALLLPAIIALARSAKISPSKLLIPLSFGSLLGGATTLIGTPPNIIVNDILLAENARAGTTVFQPFHFFSFTPIGLALLGAGILFMTTVGRRLIPDRRQEVETFESPEELIQLYGLGENLFHLRVGRHSKLANQTLAASGLRPDYGVTVIEILRPVEHPLASFGDRRLVLQSSAADAIYPTAQTVLNAGDVILVEGDEDTVRRVAAEQGLVLEPPPENGVDKLVTRQIGIAEVLLPPRSRVVGKKLKETHFAEAYNLTVLKINRPGTTEPLDLQETPLSFGDTLLVQGFWQNIHALRRNRRDLVVMGEPEVMLAAANIRKAPVALAVLVGMLALMITDVLPLATVSLLAALCMVLTGCLTMDEAYEAIDWKSVVLIAGMLPMATALERVGLVTLIADQSTAILGGAGPLVFMAGLFLLTSLLTQVLSNTATAVLIAPIAMATAAQLQVTPYAFLMAVAVAASMAFATPVASPTNTLVLGAGDYRFSDFIKVGVPMIFITLIVAVITIPIFFPF